jgi:molecular chaperone HscB
MRRFCSSSSSCNLLSCPVCHSKQLQIKDDLFCCQICPNRQGIDYFKLLNIPRTFAVDIKDAEFQYRKLQKEVHPDRLQTLQEASTIPEGYSSLLNKAIKVIKSPTERAMHLLYLIDGCSISESDLTRDPAILMEMMEYNESVDDCGSDRPCLEEQDRLNSHRLDECEKQLESLFAKREFTRVRSVCERMHFLERIKATLDIKLRQ